MPMIDEKAGEDKDYAAVRYHSSYEQVMLDVNRCAGRLEHIRQCYFHRTDKDSEQVKDLDDKLLGTSSDDDKNSFENESSDDEAHQSEQNVRFNDDVKYHRKLKKKLAKLIIRLLIKKPHLHYYQGFHDVCLTYMTTYGEVTAYEKLDKIIDSHFSQFMQPTMIETQEFLAMIPIIIGLHRPKVQEFLERAEVGTIFALSWAITWFSHVIPNEHDVESIFAFLEKFDDPHVILYVCATIVIHKSEQLLELEPEMSTVHHFLCQVPRKEKLPIEDLLREAEISFKKWPPEIVKKKLDEHRRAKLQVHNFNLVQILSRRVIPTLGDLVRAPASRTTLVVLVLASALAFNWDHWMR